MARFKYEGFSKVSRRIGDNMARAIRSSGVLEEISAKIIKDIHSGKTTSDGRKKFAALEDSTIKRRKRLATVNRTDPSYSSNKSNLTFTGQLTRSIKAKVNRSQGLIIIEPTGNRKAYRGIRKNKLKMDPKVKTNMQLAIRHASGAGNLPKREILTLSKNRRKLIVNRIRLELRRIGFKQ